MYVVKNKKRVGNKKYASTLLVEGYREGGKVKHRTILNLSSWPEELVEEFKLLLKGGKVVKLENLKHKQGKSCGGLIVVHEICKRLGISKALGKSKNGILSILLIMGRILAQQKSMLYMAKQWSKDEAIEEVLDIKYFDEDDLYEALDWLSDNQERIENELFKYRGKEEIGEIFLYDVTSSYLEGDMNELADYGYNRDGKKGKKQIIIGLLTDKEGWPVSIEVFEGNTKDQKTVLSQLKKLRDRFGVNRVIFVGDRGMIKNAQIEDLEDEFKFNFITAITKPQINKMVKNGVIQLELFDEELVEVEHEGYRYILRRNPLRAEEIGKNRESRINYIIEKIKKKNKYLIEHKKSSVEAALRNIDNEIKKRKLVGIINIRINGRLLNYEIDKNEIAEQSKFDGCYVLKTDVSKEVAKKEVIQERYKDLTKIEHAFKTMKTALEEIRPIFVIKEKRTRGHVFVCMLAFIVVKYVWEELKDLNFEQKFIFETLDRIQYISYKFQNRVIKVLPSELLEHQELILKELNIKLPQNL